MRNKNQFILVIAYLIICVVSTYGQEGGRAGAFLRRGFDSRGLAFGGAYSSISDGVSSIYWNPAGLADIENNEANLMFSILGLDRNEMFVGFGHTFPKLLSVAAGFYKFGIGGLEYHGDGYLEGNTFEDAEQSFMVAVGKEFEINENLRISGGVTAKYFYHSLADISASGQGLDLGILVTFYEMIRIGLVVQDKFNSGLEWNTSETEDIPGVTRIGISYFPKQYPMAVSAEMVQIGDNDFDYRFGLGGQIVKYFGAKVGLYKEKPTLGFFTWYKIQNYTLQLDYAVVEDNIDNIWVHHISLAVRF